MGREFVCPDCSDRLAYLIDSWEELGAFVGFEIYGEEEGEIALACPDCGSLVQMEWDDDKGYRWSCSCGAHEVHGESWVGYASGVFKSKGSGWGTTIESTAGFLEKYYDFIRAGSSCG